jgi:hypothetical protein
MKIKKIYLYLFLVLCSTVLDIEVNREVKYLEDERPTTEDE